MTYKQSYDDQKRAYAMYVSWLNWIILISFALSGISGLIAVGRSKR